MLLVAVQKQYGSLGIAVKDAPKVWLVKYEGVKLPATNFIIVGAKRYVTGTG